MAEPVWVPVSSERMSGEDVLVETRLAHPFGLASLENRLEDMAAQGWHLKSHSQWGFRYTFVRGKPLATRYFVDYGWVDFSTFWQRSFAFSFNLRIKRLPYEGERPEDRNALLSQMVMYRYIQCLYGLILVVFSFTSGAKAVSSLSTLGLGIPQIVDIDIGVFSGFFQYLTIILNAALMVLSGAINVFILLFIAILFVVIIVMQVKHIKARRRLVKAP